MPSRRKKGWLNVLVMLAMLVMFAAEARSEEEMAPAEPDRKGVTVDFHGYLEANLILRDENGFQNNFMDHLNAIQQRNTLKFDIDVLPNLTWGSLGIEKVHLTYRGAYDSIFDLRAGHYGDIPDKGGETRFDYGQRDIRFENDLREAFVDFTYRGPLGNAFFRPGRQLVSWGEASGRTLLDVINPPDVSASMFFQNPDDLKTPLWMGRLNYSLPSTEWFSVNFDLLYIPDIRPTQFGPMDKSMEAPYPTLIFQSFRKYTVKQEVPTEEKEYGAKITIDIGDKLSVSGVYFRDVVSDPAFRITLADATVHITHPVQDIFGGYFNYFVRPLDLILKGEFSHYSNFPANLPSASSDRIVAGGKPSAIILYRAKPVDKWMLAIDKNYLVKWLAPHQKSTFSFQWIHEKIREFDAVYDSGLTLAEDFDIYTASMSLFWFEGRVNPALSVTWVPKDSGRLGGTWLAVPSLSYTITPSLYAKLSIMSWWGDRDSRTIYKTAGGVSSIDTSEATIKIGYQW